MTSSYRFLLADVLTDDIVAELPVESASYGEVLNAPGTLNASIRLGSPSTVDVPPDPAAPLVDAGTIVPPAVDVLPGEHAIYVERDGVLLWGGVVWTYVADVASNTGTIGAEGFFSLLRGRILDTDYSVTGRDQALIVKDLIDTIQGYTDGDLLIDTSSIAAVGKTRDRSYAASEWKDVGEAIEQLSAVRDGFDFRVAVGWGVAGPERSFLISYPATGRATAFVLELGKNLELLSLSVDATTVVTKAYAQGEDITSTLSVTPAPYPRRDAITNHDDVSVQGTLDDHAQRALDRGTLPMRIPTVNIYPDQEPVLGSFIVGDIVEVRGVFGAVDFGGDFRITGWTAAIDTSGAERVSLSLAPTGVFA